MYEAYLSDPNAIAGAVARLLRQAAAGRRHADRRAALHGAASSSRCSRARRRAPAAPIVHPGVSTEYERKQVRVVQLICAYRQRGHQKASLDPLGLAEREHVADLDLQFHQLSAADFDTVFQTGYALHRQGRGDAARNRRRRWSAPIATRSAPSSCTSSTPSERHWIQQRHGGVRSAPGLRRRRAAAPAGAADRGRGPGEVPGLASIPGTKRFGLEGGESLIPMLDEMVQRCGGYGAQGNRDRHGAPRPPQRAGQHPRQEPAPSLFDEFEGKAHLPGLRRREVPPGLLVERDDRRAARCTWRWRSTRRTWRSWRRWSRARCARARIGASDDERRPGGADRDPRRCRLRRAGRGDGNLPDVADARLTAPAARSTSC